MHSIIFYGSYLAFPFLAFLIFLSFYKNKKCLKNKFTLIVLIIFYLLSISFIYSRFIERNLIFYKTTNIETGFSAKIVIIADIHLGIYKNEYFLQRIVNKINKLENIDAILIPGDLTYYPKENQNLEELFSPLKDLKFPAYAVLGNHDSEQPGPPLQKELAAALETHGVIFLHNSSAIIKNTDIRLLGLGDNWAEEDDINKINAFSESNNLIVMTHNPDTSTKYKNSIPDLTVSGHSHGGQIRIPYFYKNAIPCEEGFDHGFYERKMGKVFVSAGLGETGLPMRLGIPPTIDILILE